MEVATAPEPLAEVIRSLLEGSGIQCLLAGSGANEAYKVNVGAMGEVRILVRPHDSEAALELIEEARSGALEIDETFEEETP